MNPGQGPRLARSASGAKQDDEEIRSVFPVNFGIQVQMPVRL